MMRRCGPRASGGRRRGTAPPTSRLTARRKVALRERSAPNTSTRSRKPSAICAALPRAARGDRRELRRHRIRHDDRLALLRRCRSRSESSRRSRARDGRSSRRREPLPHRCRAGAAAASASRPSRSAACGAAAPDCGSAADLRAVGGEIDARRRARASASSPRSSCRSISVASSGSADACQMKSCPAENQDTRASNGCRSAGAASSSRTARRRRRAARRHPPSAGARAAKRSSITH